MNETSGVSTVSSPSASALDQVLSVTRALASPFNLHTMLEEVALCARRVLGAERASVWLLDESGQELVIEVASDLGSIRIPLGQGLVGLCARDRRIVNVADCYADPRFRRDIDAATGFHTRCSLSVPLVDHRDQLVGVLQLLNKEGGVFTAAEEPLAMALAAQCAVALTRVRMTQDLLADELMRQEVKLASQMQRHSLPAFWPELDGYDMHAEFLPASTTGGDTYDLALHAGELLLVLADAAGHGIGAAFAVTQMQAMLRMALRLGSSLETAFQHVNDQLSLLLPDGFFVNAFIGLLDPATNRLRYISGGQGPIVQLHAQARVCSFHPANCYPMGAMPLTQPREPAELVLEVGDWLLLLSDGLFEQPDASGQPFGRARVQQLVLAGREGDAGTLAQALLQAVREHAQDVEQADDITLVLLRRWS